MGRGDGLALVLYAVLVVSAWWVGCRDESVAINRQTALGLHAERCSAAFFFDVCGEMVVVKELLDISAG